MASQPASASAATPAAQSCTTVHLSITGDFGATPAVAPLAGRGCTAVHDFERMLGQVLAAGGDCFGYRLWLDLAARLTALAGESRQTPEQARKLSDRAAEAHAWARAARSREAMRTTEAA